MEFHEKTCTPCQGGLAPLAAEDATTLLRDSPGWRLADDATRLVRDFKFPDFAQALAFVNAVGALAETEGHHPDIKFGWGYVSITLFTHKIQGLHENDFIMAAKFGHEFGTMTQP
jgi:4a-hydroxytetrahydrobiopterin dehydratase